MKKEYSFIVGEKDSKCRIDLYLAGRLKNVSRTRIKSLIKDGMIRLNGEVVKAHHLVHHRDRVEVVIPPPEEPSIDGEDIPLDILYEDEHLIAVNKPAGMVVHPAAGNYSHTLVNALVSHCRELAAGTHPLRPGIVHRLDKDTSGCIIAAKDDVVHRKLMELFSGREVYKEYRAIVGGNVKDNEGEIETLIDRSRRDRKKMAVSQIKGREAVTHYSVLERFYYATYLSIIPRTGRTHQIRVHLSHIQHPVLGDRQYSRRKILKVLGIEIPRQMLHAHKISFSHPVSGEKMEFCAPIPEDFEGVLNYLRKEGQV